jgi:uncharacterized protein involved in exopolysaccharide biosynthesis
MEWLGRLQRYWRLIAVVMAVSILAAAAYAQRQPRVYAARAVLQIDAQERKVLNKIESIAPDKLDTEDNLKTVGELLAGGSLLLEVARVTGVDKEGRTAPVHYRNAEGMSGSEPRVVEAMRRKIRVSLRRGTRLVDVMAEDEDPARAAEIANALPQIFIQRVAEQNAALARLANESLLSEARRLKAKWEASEQKLQQYREVHQAVSLEEKQNITVEKLKDLNAKATAARSERLKLESDLDELNQAGERDAESILRLPSVAALPNVIEIRTQLIRARGEFASIRQRYLPAHPKYVAAESQIADLTRLLAEAVQRARQTLLQQCDAARETEVKLAQALREQEESALALSRIGIPYAMLVREAETDRALYDNVMMRLKETGVSPGLQQLPYRMVDAAIADPRPIRPRKLSLWMLGAIGGMLISGVLILALERIPRGLPAAGQGPLGAVMAMLGR